MDRWTGRVALVTGASAGIGAAIAQELVRKGMKVVGAARRVDRVKELNAVLGDAPGKLYPLELDVSQEESILKAFEWITKHLGGVDVLINNAGVTENNANLAHSETQNWSHILDVNVLGLSICTREAVKSMQSRGVDDGHIIHINSVCGHYIVDYPGVGMYSASKYGVTALTEALRKELVKLNSKIRITSISPGRVETEFALASGAVPDLKANAAIYAMFPHLKSHDIADSVTYVLGAPAHVQITELTIRPVGEDF